MYNMSEHSDSYSRTSRILWIYYRGEVNDDVKEKNDVRD